MQIVCRPSGAHCSTAFYPALYALG